jgi:hypothetical protein
MAPATQPPLLAHPVQIFWTPYDPLDLASGSLDHDRLRYTFQGR